MTDPEIEYRRLTSGDAAAISEAVERVRGGVIDVDRAQEDLAGCTVAGWTGLAADAYAARLDALRTGVAKTHVALNAAQVALATAADAYSTAEGSADYFIGYWRSRPSGLPAVVEELYARLINGLLLATGTTYNARLAGVGAALTGDDEQLSELSDEAREWVEEGLAKNAEWLDEFGSSLGPRIPSIGAWGDGRGLIPQGLGYDPATGLLLQGYYDHDDGDLSALALIDEVTGRPVGEVLLGGEVAVPGQESKDYGTPGHAGGVTVDGDHVYVTDNGTVYTYSLSEMRGAGAGATVQPESVQTGTKGGSYSAIHDGLLYLGTFEKDTSKEGTLHVYRPDGSGGWVEMPDRAVPTPPQAQGVIVRDGEFVFSTSWGRHNESSLVVQQADGSRESHTFPNMSEGLVEVDGNVLVTYESGATAYSTPTLVGSGWLWWRDDPEGLWANRHMTSTPLSGLGLSGEMGMSPDSLKAVAAELDSPSSRLSSTSHETAAIHVAASDFGRVPQAPDFARTIRQLLTALTAALRAHGRAVGHAADSLRDTSRDALRTDDAVFSGFNRARLD